MKFSDKKIKGVQRKAYPGDKVYVMSEAHTDDAGNVYPAGTEYTPISAGSDNIRGFDQIVNIAGKNVEFTF